MTVDRFGRRKPLIIGPILMAIFLAWQAAIAQKFSNPSYSNQGVGIAGLASIFLFSGAFSASFGPVSWIYQVKQRLQDRTSVFHHTLTLYFETITLSPSHDPLLSITQSEIFPMNQRAYGTAVSTASNWVSTRRYFSRDGVG
jgi:MFS family permease